MATGLTTTLEITGDRDLFERVSKAARSTRELMNNVGQLGMASGVRRLTEVLQQKGGEDAVRSGRLMSSLVGGASGKPEAETIFEISDLEAVVGTNVPYAKQRQEGGPIFPVKGKALAIPIPIALKRAKQSPYDIDPNRTILQFVPIFRGKVVGLLVDGGVEGPLEKRKRTREAKTAYGPGPLFVLMWYVEQEGTPFLFWGPEDLKVIDEELIPKWLRLK